MGLTNAIEVETPTEYGVLRKDKDGESCNAGFNYLSIVGVLLYLRNKSRPELTFQFHNVQVILIIPNYLTKNL